MAIVDREQNADGSRWCQEMALQTLQELGYESIDVHTLPHDLVSDYYVASKPRGIAS